MRVHEVYSLPRFDSGSNTLWTVGSVKAAGIDYETTLELSDTTVRFWDQLHKTIWHPDNNFGGDIGPRQMVREFIERYGPKLGKRALEHACGNGRNLQYLLELGYDAYGFDYSHNALRNLYARFKNDPEAMKRVRLGTTSKIPFPDGSFDFVCAHGGLFQGEMSTFDGDDRKTFFGGVLKAFQEIHRVLRDGGYASCALRSIEHPLEGVVLDTDSYVMKTPEGEKTIMTGPTCLLVDGSGRGHNIWHYFTTDEIFQLAENPYYRFSIIDLKSDVFRSDTTSKYFNQHPKHDWIVTMRKLSH